MMDSSKGKSYSHRGGKSSAFLYNYHSHDNNYCNMSSNRGIYKSTRMQRHTLRCRKDYHSRGNYRARFPYSRNNSGSIKSNKSAEDVEEEERKKKLTDTANRLLSKIKSWNAESKDESQQNSVSPVVRENSCSDEKVSSEGKPKRIAHSKKGKLMKNKTKSFNQPGKSRYDVNKDTVKDFQNRIQHKLIEEIMQMPKENLQNVLNDPKINPIMEVKMSRLVRENKLLIAQKLRALAESKMKSPGSSTNAQLLVDIDKLIDPVIETDLSVLPFELIKQMENVFQVQFDYSLNSDSQVESSVSDTATDNIVITEDLNSGKELCLKAENNEDLSLYECSTDEDEEFDCLKSVDIQQDSTARTQEDVCSNDPKMGDLQINEVNTRGKNRKRKRSAEFKLPVTDPGGVVGKNLEYLPSCSPASTHCVPEHPTQISPSTAIESKSTGCQTESNLANSCTQTVSNTISHLYGVPLPKEATDKSASSLLEEVNSIQTLTNKLNERRFQIFLQLSKTDGNFIADGATKTNFIETIANGSMSLAESLERFFSSPQHSSAKSKDRRKPPEGHTSNRPRYPGEKKTQN